MGVYEEIKQALQDIVAPELRSLQTEIKRLDGKLGLFTTSYFLKWRPWRREAIL